MGYRDAVVKHAEQQLKSSGNFTSCEIKSISVVIKSENGYTISKESNVETSAIIMKVMPNGDLIEGPAAVMNQE
jgi:hypothetical protein